MWTQAAYHFMSPHNNQVESDIADQSFFLIPLQIGERVTQLRGKAGAGAMVEVVHLASVHAQLCNCKRLVNMTNKLWIIQLG